jgi:hypothetical protein
VDNQQQTANSTPPNWAAFKKMGDSSAPSASPSSDHSYSAPPMSSVPQTSPVPTVPSDTTSVPPIVTNLTSVPEDKKDGVGGLGSGIKNLLGLSKEPHQNTVPIKPSTPVKEDLVAPLSPEPSPTSLPTQVTEEETKQTPPSAITTSSPDAPASMPIPSFIPEPPVSNPVAIENPLVTPPSQSEPTFNDQTLVSNLENKTEPTKPPTAPETSPAAVSPSPPTTYSTTLPDIHEVPVSSFAPLSTTPVEATALANSQPETTTPSLPFPQANLSPTPPLANNPPPTAEPITYADSPTTPEPLSPSVSPPPVASQPLVSNLPPQSSPPPQNNALTSITPSPQPTLPSPTQATPEPPPLTEQNTPVIKQSVMQAPEFAPEPAPEIAPSLENPSTSPQPVSEPSTPPNLSGFLTNPPSAEPQSTEPAINFPGQQSPPPIVSTHTQSSGGLRKLGGSDNVGFDLLANPVGDSSNPPYLAPVATPLQQQSPVPQKPAAQQQPPSRRLALWPVVGGVAVALIIIGIVAYFLITKLGNPSSTNPSTLGTSDSENQAVLAAALGPTSWENNYSNSLLPIERSGLELAITDPASTPINQTSSLSKTDVKSLVITVAKAEVHLATQTVIANQANISATQSASRTIDRWETLRLENNSPTDLIDLRRKGGAIVNLGTTFLAVGHYTELRIYLSSAILTTNSGEKFTLNLSPNNGIVKVVKPFDVATTSTVKLTTDINAPASVTGSSGNYNFNPVLSRFLVNGSEL